MTDKTNPNSAAGDGLSGKLSHYKSVADLARDVMVTSKVLSREHMEQAARTYLVSYLTGDLETRAALFADDATFEDPVGAEPLRGMTEIMNFWRAAIEIRWWAAHDLRKVVVCGNEVMLHFISTMRVPGLEKAAMEVFELQVFNDAGKIAKVRVFFDAECLLPGGVTVLIETPGGFDYTPADCRGWMKAAGFKRMSMAPLGGPDSMVVAIK